jgi:hypothetical protein
MHNVIPVFAAVVASLAFQTPSSAQQSSKPLGSAADATNIKPVCAVDAQFGIEAVAGDVSVFFTPENASNETEKRCGPGRGWKTTVTGNTMAAYTKAADANGSLFLAMIPRPSMTGTPVVLKIDAAGREQWRSEIQTNRGLSFFHIALAPRTGDVYVSGTYDGQFPGKPAEATGTPFLAKFGSDGKRAWLEQSDKLGSRQGMVVDSSGNAYLLGRASVSTLDVTKVNPAGKVVWHSTGIPNDHGASQNIAVSPDGKGVYVGSTTVTKLNGKGSVAWTQKYNLTHETKIDPVEGVMSKGSAGKLTGLVFSKGKLYLMTGYLKQYEYGSTPREGHMDLLVVAVNPTNGKPSWTKQYKHKASLAPESYGMLANGDLWVAGKSTSEQSRSITNRLRTSNYNLLKSPSELYLIKPSGQAAQVPKGSAGATAQSGEAGTGDTSDANAGASTNTSPSAANEASGAANLSKKEKAKRWFKGESN